MLLEENLEPLTIIAFEHSAVVVHVVSLSSANNSFLKGFMHFASAEGYLLNFLSDEVAQNGDCFAVLAIKPELTAARVLMQGDERATI